jgi:AcrR family transcriptional regulator
MPNGTHRTKRDEILEVACELFYEQGYHQTGIHQIIQQANTAKGTFYSHFPSKEHLGVYWLKTRHQQWMRSLQESIEKEKDAESRLLGIFKFIGKWMVESDFRGCAFINTLCETPKQGSLLRKETAEHKQSLIEFLEPIIAELHPEQSPEQQRDQARFLFLLIEGTIVAMQNFKATWPAEVALKQTEARLFQNN